MFSLILYNLLLPFLAVLYLAAVALSSRRALLKNFSTELRQRLGLYPRSVFREIAGHAPVWFHAASVGEVNVLSALVPRLKPHKILVTTSSAIGREQSRKIPGVDWAFLAPLDLYPLVWRLIRKWSPKILILVETELWPSLITCAWRNGVPIALVNGRISDKSFPRYRRVRSLMRTVLSKIDPLCVQTDLDRRRFLDLGSSPGSVRVLGNIKFDALKTQTPSPDPKLREIGWREQDLIFVAGSTHAEEEGILIQTFENLRSRLPNLKMILAPRHVERCPAILKQLQNHGISSVLWSAADSYPLAAAECLVLDEMGKLPRLYQSAAVVFVGGTLCDRGGHNLLEPAAVSKPVLFGPHTQNTRSVAEALRECGGGFQVNGPDDLQSTLSRLLEDPALRRTRGERARRAIATLQGGSERTAAAIKSLL